MGKKARSKREASRNVPASSSPRSLSQPKRGHPSLDAKDPCEHYVKDSAAENRFLLKIRSGSADTACEDCRDEPEARMGGKGKGKGNKGGDRKKSAPVKNKPASAPPTMWVCLECGHFGCGGDADISKPYGHARRHHKQNKHTFAARLDDPRLCWCFPCELLIRIELPESTGSESGKVAHGREVVEQEVDGGGKESENLVVDVGKGYAVRGLVNLGNTCFFNSIMQNLFAMDSMRDHFARENVISGHLSMALKKLFAETGSGAESCKGIVNPKNFFGSVCSKAPQFRGYQQQDSHELLRYLLDGLSTEDASLRKQLPSSGPIEGKISPQPPPTFVDNLFGGQISSTICCVECGHTSVVYEPFLDLSLPLPSRKAPPKKVVAAQPKKIKPPPGSRARKGRERIPVKLPGLDQLKEENTDAPLGTTEQIISDPASSESVPGAAYSTSAIEGADATSSAGGDENCMDAIAPISQGPDETCWMDFIGTSSRTSDEFAIRDAEDMGVIQNKDDDRKRNTTHEQPMLEESSQEMDKVSSAVQDYEILQLPHKEAPLISKEAAENSGESQNPGNETSVDNLMSTTRDAASFSSGCGANEAELDGLGDLFAEPEVSSAPSIQMGASEDPESYWFSGTGSESSEEVVDNADAQVSVNSCLAFFTKPELLSGEHAWLCENCCKILQQKQTNHKQTTSRNHSSDMLRTEVTNHVKDNGISLNGDSVDTSHDAFTNEKLVHSAKWKISASETCRDADSQINCSNTGASSVVENACHNGDCSKLHRPGACQANCSKVCDEDGDIADACQDNCSQVCDEDGDAIDSGTSKYSSRSSSSINKTDCQVSDLDGGSCCNNNLDGDAYEAQNLEACSKVSSDFMELEDTSYGAFGKGRCKNSQKVRKKGTQLLPNKSTNEDLEPENMKVKRDATKRILIHKSPPILTIHLKRFGQDVRGRLNKLGGHVSFQEMLDLAPYMDQRGTESHCYRLVGLVEHSGNMRGGHYIAYVRGQRSEGKAGGNGSNRTWFHASDAYVREASLSEVLQREAYILFYERVEP